MLIIEVNGIEILNDALFIGLDFLRFDDDFLLFFLRVNVGNDGDIASGVAAFC